MIQNKTCLIDLHLHLDGSLSIDSVKKLAKAQNIEIPTEDAVLNHLLSVSEDCRNLNEYLEKFAFPGSLLQTKNGISMSIVNLAQELRDQGLMYAEYRFAPQKHLERGLSQREVIEAAIEGLNQSCLPGCLILCCMRMSDNREANLETVRLAKDYLGKGVAAVDLAGAEALYVTEKFWEEFSLARKLGVPCTIHAGEADGPGSIYTALSFGANRIGHGIQSYVDEMLLQRLAQEKIPLECCPTSNLNTQIFDSIQDYPIRKLLNSGVRFTVNTDNMSVSATTLKREWQKLIDAFQLTQAEVKQILLNSVEAAFAPDSLKAEMRQKVEAEFH